jgi:hypothetical protein
MKYCLLPPFGCNFERLIPTYTKLLRSTLFRVSLPPTCVGLAPIDCISIKFPFVCLTQNPNYITPHPPVTTVFFMASPKLHCKENPIYVFLFWELRGLRPNFHIHVSLSDLYTLRISPHISLQQNRQPDPRNI